MVSIQTSLSYVMEDLQQGKGYQIFTPIDESKYPRTNLHFETCQGIQIHDARQKMDSFTLDLNGFQFLRRRHDHGTDLDADRIANHEDNEAILAYLQQLEIQLQHDLGAEKVIFYDWRLRQNQKTAPKELITQGADRSLLLAPARHVHADESGCSAHKILLEHLTPTEKEIYLSGQWRLRIVNIWRPLVDIVRDSPLTLCDIRSIEESDWLLCDQIHEDRVDESMYLKHRPNHKWYWLSNQTREEMTLFVVFDSAKFRDRTCSKEVSTPHASFDNPSAEGLYTRRSIEVRSIVYTKT